MDFTDEFCVVSWVAFAIHGPSSLSLEVDNQKGCSIDDFSNLEPGWIWVHPFVKSDFSLGDSFLDDKGCGYRIRSHGDGIVDDLRCSMYSLVSFSFIENTK